MEFAEWQTRFFPYVMLPKIKKFYPPINSKTKIEKILYNPRTIHVIESWDADVATIKEIRVETLVFLVEFYQIWLRHAYHDTTDTLYVVSANIVYK